MTMKMLDLAVALAAVGLVAASPTAARSLLRPCTARDLHALGGTLQGATGSMVGLVSFRNVASAPCRVGGRPRLEIVNRSGKRLKIRERPITSGAVGGMVVTSLIAGRREDVFVQWSNWCGVWRGRVGTFRPLLLRATLTTGLRLTFSFRSGRPRCDQPQQPSTLFVSPFVVGR